MRIILKNLKQVEYEIQIESNSITVKDLKKEIEKLYSFDSEQIKLLSGGMILDNAKALSEYNIKENSIIIMMNTKIKQISNQTNNIQNNDNNNINNNNKVQIQNNSKQNNISEILKDNLKIQIDSLVDMGFEKSQVEIAVKAANGRIDLAIEYLNNGIPDNINRNSNLRNNNRNNNSNNNQSEIKRELKKQAGIIKVLCKDNKFMIFSILDNIKRNDPGLLRLITDYRNEFEKLLDMPITEEDEQYYKSLETKADEIINKRKEEKEKELKEKEEKEKKIKEKEENEKDIKEKEIKEKEENENKEDKKDENKDKIEDKNNTEINEIKNKNEEQKNFSESKANKEEENKQDEKKETIDTKNINENQNPNQLTNEDNQIIERLKKLGDFPHEKVVEAYIVCNKNEELTANYLFEQYN